MVTQYLAASQLPNGAIVAPLRGLCWFWLATALYAALHPRLFKGNRYAVAMPTIFYPYRSGYSKVTATRSQVAKLAHVG
jgi:hypothetical protein